MTHVSWDRALLSARDIAGDASVIDPIASLALRDRLVESLRELSEPGILIIDFLKTRFVHASYLILALADPLELNSKENWTKAIVCTNTAVKHREELLRAARAMPHLRFDFESVDRVLILASDRQVNPVWHMLVHKPLEKRELAVWDFAREAGKFTLQDLIDSFGITYDDAIEHLHVFLSNKVILSLQIESETWFYSANYVASDVFGDT